MSYRTTYYSNRHYTPPLAPQQSLRCWLRADYGTVWNAAGQLVRWADQGAEGLDLLPLEGMAVRSPEMLNGQSMIRVSGRFASERNCGITGNMPRSVYFLGRLVDRNVVVSWGTNGQGNLFECMQANNSPLLHAYGGGMDNWYTLSNQAVYEPALWVWRYNGEGGGFSDFNYERGSQGGPPYMNTVDTPLYLAWGDYYGSSVVDVLELLVYDRFLSAADDEQLRAYLLNRSGI